jgi:hypothetical protein
MTRDERAKIRADSLARLAVLDRRRAIGLTVPESNESGAQVVCIRALDALDAADAERDKLQRFKDWCHSYLDSKGVPHHPPGTHGAEGCRIGDRMDWVWVQLAARDAESAHLRALLAPSEALEKTESLDAIMSRLGERDPYGLWGTQALRDITSLVAEVLLLRAQVAGHAERIAAQSEILSRRAEKVTHDPPGPSRPAPAP